MDKIKKALIEKSFFIALVYVGLGTSCVLPVFNDTILDGDWRVFDTFYSPNKFYKCFNYLCWASKRFAVSLCSSIYYFSAILVYSLFVYKETI
jgi:hypothetical protein